MNSEIRELLFNFFETQNGESHESDVASFNAFGYHP